METEGSLPSSQQPSTDPYSEPDESSPQPHKSFPLRSVLIVYSYLRLGLKSGSLPFRFPNRNSACSCHLFHALLFLLILFAVITFGKEQKLRVLSCSLRNYLHPHVTSPLGANIFPSAPCSQTPLFRSCWFCSWRFAPCGFGQFFRLFGRTFFIHLQGRSK
jgi:hypothetical protein